MQGGRGGWNHFKLGRTIKNNILQKYKKTYGCAQVGNLTSNSSVADLINKYTHMDKGNIHLTM